MVITYRNEPLNMADVAKTIAGGIKVYFEKNSIKCAVLGLSGGIDSTVVAALCKMAGVRLVGVSLPSNTNEAEESSCATTSGFEFCDEFIVEGIQETFEAVNKLCSQVSGMAETPVSQGNVKARLRMTVLYDIASKKGGIVMDTDNLTEHFLGFFTIHGDDGDFNPIGNLWKHEVYELARYLKGSVFTNSRALDMAMSLVPTDGNGVKEGGDLAQIAPGHTYDEVDEILNKWVLVGGYISPSDFHSHGGEDIVRKYGQEFVDSVISRSSRSEFKRKKRPFIVNVYSGDICEKDGAVYISTEEK